jgi:hypothetical protein
VREFIPWFFVDDQDSGTAAALQQNGYKLNESYLLEVTKDNTSTDVMRLKLSCREVFLCTSMAFQE